MRRRRNLFGAALIATFILSSPDPTGDPHAMHDAAARQIAPDRSSKMLPRRCWATAWLPPASLRRQLYSPAVDHLDAPICARIDEPCVGVASFPRDAVPRPGHRGRSAPTAAELRPG